MAVKLDHPEARPALPDPEPVKQLPVHWVVSTPEKPVKTVLYGLSPKDYEVLAKNTAELLRWMKEAAWRLRYYQGE